MVGFMPSSTQYRPYEMDRNLMLNRRPGRVAALILAVMLCALFVLARDASAAISIAPIGQSATLTPTSLPTAAAKATATATPKAVVEAAEVVTSTETLALEDLADFNGIPVGFTEDGFPFMGDPAAPVVMTEYSDYLCPFCGRHFSETLPTLIDEYVLTGKVKFVFRDFPIPALHPNAPLGHQAAWCVGQEDPVAYWFMHDALFGRQPEWNQLQDPSEFLAGVAEEAGADPDVYQACMDSGETIALVDAGIADGEALGFSGTPTFVFSGEAFTDTFTLVGAYPLDSFRQWADAMLAGEAPPEEPQAPEQQLPPWASEEGLAPDPDRPGYNLYGDPYKGSDDALVTIIEFSDMQCPACANHANEVQPALDEEFVETGKVRWVFKHRPLPMHPYAPVGAAAVECAADQGQFWEMHDALYANVDTWTPPEAEFWQMQDTEDEITKLAKDLGLDGDLFDECLNDRESLERVLTDLYDAEGVVSSTPTFVVLYGGQGTLLNGSRPAADFAEILNNFVGLAEEESARGE
jgi:protein-disulfide isomerase